MKVVSQSVKREERAERRYVVEGLPPLTEYMRGHGAEERPVLLDVQIVTLVWINGAFRTAKLEGFRLKSNGKPGRVDGSRWIPARMFEPARLKAMEDHEHIRPPDWLVDMVRTAPEPSMLEFQTQEDQRSRGR